MDAEGWESRFHQAECVELSFGEPDLGLTWTEAKGIVNMKFGTWIVTDFWVLSGDGIRVTPLVYAGGIAIRYCVPSLHPTIVHTLNTCVGEGGELKSSPLCQVIHFPS